MKKTLLLCTAVFALACEDDMAAGSSSPGTLEITPINVGFGCTQIGCDSTHQITIRNAGKGELYVRSITFAEGASGEYTYTTNKPLPVAMRGGDELEIEVQYRPSDQKADAAVLVIEHNGQTAPGTRIGPRPYQALVYVRGRELGIPHLIVDSETLTFGYVPVGSERIMNVRVTNDGTGVAILALEPPTIKSGAALPFVIDPLAAGDLLVNPRESKNIAVRFRPHQLGLFREKLVLASNDGEVDEPLEIELRGTAYSGPKLVAVPPVLDFGEVRQGTSKTITVTLTSGGSEPLQYGGMAVLPIPNGSTAQAAQFTVLPLGRIEPLNEPFTTFQAEVTFTPSLSGLAKARLVVNTPNSVDPSEVPLQGSGTNPIIEVTPSSMDWGTVVSGWTVAPKEFIVRNAGNGTLHVEKVKLETGSSLSYALDGLPALPFDMPTGVQFTAKVTFASGGLGPQNGTVGVYTYDLNTPEKTISLTALGESCEARCPLANAQPNCATGTCQIWKCDAHYFDVNVTPDDGCECAQESVDPGDGCAIGVDAGTLSDNGTNRTYGDRKIVPVTDVDWFKVRAADDWQLGDKFKFRANLSGAGHAFCVYRSKDDTLSCILGNEQCGLTSYTRDGDDFADDTENFYVKVYRLPGSSGCENYSLTLSNG